MNSRNKTPAPISIALPLIEVEVSARRDSGESNEQIAEYPLEKVAQAQRELAMLWRAMIESESVNQDHMKSRK